MSLNPFVRTLVAPPKDIAWAWALELPAAEPLKVGVVSELTIDPRRPPSENELVLWFAAPDGQGDPNVFDCLSDEERSRAGRFQFEADRWAFAAAHSGLRILLGSMVSCAPDALRFAADAKGKPSLDHGRRSAEVRFSISHTRGCVAVAVAKRAVGVDVELRRTLPDIAAVAKTAFAPEAYAAVLARAESSARTSLFYRYWTLSEAFVKATGEGIAQDTTSFAFTDEGPPELIRVSANWGPSGRWRFACEP